MTPPESRVASPGIAESALIRPSWSAPASVKALATTRRGGASIGSYSSLNLGRHCGDEPDYVRENRRRLQGMTPFPLLWLRQVHGTESVYAPRQALSLGDGTGMDTTAEIEADASWTDRAGVVLVIQTADCLPILLCDRRGGWVAAIHAGWRGLAAGIIARMLERLPGAPHDMLAWLGPGIGQAHYEVGAEVRAAFCSDDVSFESAFQFNGKGWQADLYAIARQQLHGMGVTEVSGGDRCTYAEHEHFFSHRREQRSGRQATCIWLEEAGR